MAHVLCKYQRSSLSLLRRRHKCSGDPNRHMARLRHEFSRRRRSISSVATVSIRAVWVVGGEREGVATSNALRSSVGDRLLAARDPRWMEFPCASDLGYTHDGGKASSPSFKHAFW